jgi:hypothetical protein
MRKLTFEVTDEMADNLIRLAEKGRLRNDSERDQPRWKAFNLVAYFSREPEKPRQGRHQFWLDGKKYKVPKVYSYGGEI